MAKQIAKPSKVSAVPASIQSPVVTAALEVIDRGSLYITSLAEYADKLKLIKPASAMPQAVMLAASKAHKVSSESESTYEYFRGYATSFREGGGKFEPGKMAIVFKDDSGTRKPKWKEQAVAEAAEVYRLRTWIEQHSPHWMLPPEDWQPSAKFDRDGYEKAVLDDTPKPEGKTQVQLVLSD